MKKRLMLLMVPALMLSGCTVLNFDFGADKNNPDDAAYRPTVVITDEQKGTAISYSDAKAELEDIAEKNATRSQKLRTAEGKAELAEEMNLLSYDLKVKMDDYYVLDGFDFSKNDKYLHNSLHAEVPETDLSKSGFTVNKVEVVNGKEDADHYLYSDSEGRVVEAAKVAANGKKGGEEWQENSKLYSYLDANYDELVLDPLCESLGFIGDQTTKLMDKLTENMNKYVSENTEGELAFGGTIAFSSKGEGHLFIDLSMPTIGLETTVLFDNNWLTYGYMHINLTKAKEYGIVGDDVVFDRMTTELSVDFSDAKVEYPDLSQYEAR